MKSGGNAILVSRQTRPAARAQPQIQLGTWSNSLNSRSLHFTFNLWCCQRLHCILSNQFWQWAIFILHFKWQINPTEWQIYNNLPHVLMFMCSPPLIQLIRICWNFMNQVHYSQLTNNKIYFRSQNENKNGKMRNNIWKMDYFYTYFLFFSVELEMRKMGTRNGPREMAKRTSETHWKCMNCSKIKLRHGKSTEMVGKIN